MTTGDWVAQVPGEYYTHAGVARKAGQGLALEVACGTYYIIPEDLPSLSRGEEAAVVDPSGEQEGLAWLSPVNDRRKRELTAMIQARFYIIPLRDMTRVLSGESVLAPVRQYHPA